MEVRNRHELFVRSIRGLFTGLFVLVTVCSNTYRNGRCVVGEEVAAETSVDKSPVYGRWRTLSQGPLGAGIIQLDIETGEHGEPVIILDGQLRGLIRYPWENAVVTADAASADFRFLSYDIIGFASGPAQLEAHLVPGGDLLKVKISNHNRTATLVFERDGPKFARFDAPRLKTDGTRATDYIYTPPARRAAEDIEVASLEDVGLEPELFEKAVREGILADEYPRLTSLLVMKDRKLVFEEYFNGNHADFLHYQASVSKTYTGTLYGIALRDGVIKDIDASVIDLLPQYGNTRWGRQGVDATLRDFLMMKDLVGWDEGSVPYNHPDNDLIRAIRSGPDPFRFLFERPLLAADAARRPAYNTMMSHTLGLILMRQAGKNLMDYINEALFEPMNIERAYWGTWSPIPIAEKDAVPLAGSTLHLRSRDMVKFGQLLLDGGRWQGRQIVPEDWVLQATTVRALMSPRSGYGYQTWIHKLSDGETTLWRVAGDGHGGQFINVVPALNAVIVTTAAKYYGEGKSARALIAERILPAMVGGTAPFTRQTLTAADIGYRPLD